MDSRQRIVQRSVDGELGAAENAALTHLLTSDQDARDTAQRMEGLDRLLRADAARLARDEAADDLLVAKICNHLPAGSPQRQQQIRIYDVAFAGIALTAVVLFYGLVGSMRDLLPLTSLAIISLAAGVLLVGLASPLRKAETSVFSRIMRKRMNIGDGDLMVYRVTGIAIVIGAIWLLSEIA